MWEAEDSVIFLTARAVSTPSGEGPTCSRSRQGCTGQSLRTSRSGFSPGHSTGVIRSVFARPGADGRSPTGSLSLRSGSCPMQEQYNAS